jgi:predicted GNAT family N-acyltransferase
MDAKVFQEKNAFGSLNKGEQTLEGAKQQYQQAKNAQEREKAIASMQAAIDSLEQLPNVTLSADTAQIKLKAYKRDFENARIGTFIAAAQEFDIEAEQTKQKQPQAASELWQQAINRLSEIPQENPRYLEAQKLLTSYRIKIASVVDPRSGTLIESAKQFAFAAAKASQNPPHSAIEWQQIEKLWEKAIEQLQKIRDDEPGYLEAQKLLATYETNVGIVQTRFSAEQEAQEILKAANRQIQNLIASPPSDRNQFKGEMQGIINQLRTIKPGTTAYKEAQQLLAYSYKKLK